MTDEDMVVDLTLTTAQVQWLQNVVMNIGNAQMSPVVHATEQEKLFTKEIFYRLQHGHARRIKDSKR